MTNAVSLAQGGSNNVTFRNRIINGAMVIDQRNAGASVSSGTGAVTYTVDRWFVYATGAAVQVQRVAGSTVPYVLQVTGAASNTVATIAQRIESYNIADLAGQTVTVSFIASSSTLSSITWGCEYANSVDNFTGGVTSIATGSQAITSTETRYSFSVALPTNAKNGIDIYFSNSGITSGTLKIGNVQLEAGTTATPFENRLYGTELALCQRYYQVLGTGVTTTGNLVVTISLFAPLRVTPSNITTTLTSGSGASFVVWTTAQGGFTSLVQSGNNSGNASATVTVTAEL